MNTVAALFTRKTSPYLALGCDCYDFDRDARTYSGAFPVVAHPPCRAWGKLSHFAKPRHDERDLAFFAVEQVRRVGGVLEHPQCSRLWPEAGLPAPGQFDRFGGFTFAVSQKWFGHRAEKKSLLYVLGCAPGDFPALPFDLAPAVTTVEAMGKAEREKTPAFFASWLVELARSCHG